HRVLRVVPYLGPSGGRLANGVVGEVKGVLRRFGRRWWRRWRFHRTWVCAVFLWESGDHMLAPSSTAQVRDHRHQRLSHGHEQALITNFFSHQREQFNLLLDQFGMVNVHQIPARRWVKDVLVRWRFGIPVGATEVERRGLLLSLLRLFVGRSGGGISDLMSPLPLEPQDL